MRHELFGYGSDQSLVERVAPFLAEGLAEDEAAIAVTTPHRHDLLREALGAAAEQALFLDRDAFYTRPEAAIARYDAAAREIVTGRIAGIRVMGELPICRSRAEWNVWVCYEAILNRAIAHHPAWILCAYDTRDVPPDVADLLCHAHPVVSADQDSSPTHHGYVAPEAMVRAFGAEPLPAVALDTLPLQTDPRRFRETLAAAMASAGVQGERAARLQLAASEVLANAERHGGGLRSLRAGRIGDHFVCELADRGHGIHDPLAGFLPPRAGSDSGAGLWVARQVTWRLELVPSLDGLAVRLWD